MHSCNQQRYHRGTAGIILPQIMGEAKRRKAALGEKFGQEAQIVPWLPITKKQAQQFVEWSTRGAWFGIGFLVLWWITVRFVGPAFGWWQVT